MPDVPLLETSTHELLRQFYVPALSLSTRYDRGVGYFTSGWIRLAATGLAKFATNRGRARMIASPALSREDWESLCQGSTAVADPELAAALTSAVDDLEVSLEKETLTALAWMIFDGILEFRIAVPIGDLDGDFHDKFGIFQDADGDAISFNGSPNDSQKAFRNYESMTIDYSWISEREKLRVSAQQARFERLWDNRDPNVRVYGLPEAIRRRLVRYTEHSSRPYQVKRDVDEMRWRHQQDALSAFLDRRHGILEMATGTGKTRTALKILNELKERGLIRSAIVTATGTDLLDQWYLQLARDSGMRVYRMYERHHDALSFVNDPDGAVLLTSREFFAEVSTRLQGSVVDRSIFIADEVHGLGSPALRRALAGRIQKYKYRLGLSATPEREYDPEGNVFIEAEIGPVIFRFGLKQAIERGILCEFDYVPLEYAFSDEDKARVRQIIATYHAREKAGEPMAKETLYQEIARVRKLSLNKLEPFREYLRNVPQLLDRALIFVETAEYGFLVQQILLTVAGNFHTYYGDDHRSNLTRFARGEFATLLTCHRLSEGIDIRSVSSVILFSASRAKLETIQRLGRCLRIDPENPSKRAVVVDFIRTDDVDPLDDPTVDVDRRDWLLDLAATRRKVITAGSDD